MIYTIPCETSLCLLDFTVISFIQLHFFNSLIAQLLRTNDSQILNQHDIAIPLFIIFSLVAYH